MIRVLFKWAFTDGLSYIEGACVDADVSNLPTSGIVTGSKFVCADSGDEYMFAEGDSPAWNKIKGAAETAATVEEG